MNASQDIYEYYQETQLCVNQDVFLKLSLLTYDQLQHWCKPSRKRKLRRVRTAGNGRTALIDWSSILDLLYLTGHKVKSVLAVKTNFAKCQERKGITL